MRGVPQSGTIASLHPGRIELKALVIGGTGLVGGALLRALAQRSIPALGTYRSRPTPGLVSLDMTDADALRALVEDYRPTVIFLSAALTAVDYCEDHQAEAQRTNVGGARAAAEAAVEADAKLVLFSTEYVFDGTAGPYSEDAQVSPQGVYSRSKLDGERVVQELAPDHLIIRTTVVFDWDPGSKNFAMQLCERLGAGERMRVAADQVGNPTLARYLADASIRLAEQDTRGIVNVVGRDRVPRSEFAVRLASALGLDPVLIDPLPTSALGQMAPRPLDAGLTTDKAASLLGEPPIALDEAIGLFVAARGRDLVPRELADGEQARDRSPQPSPARGEGAALRRAGEGETSPAVEARDRSPQPSPARGEGAALRGAGDGETTLAVETRGLRKRYGSVLAVDGVDLAIESGEIFGLLGPNGAGKTTTIKMLLGLAKPSQGYAAVFGHQLPGEANRVRQLVGYVTQEVALDRNLTARENLRLVASLYHVPGRDAARRIDELLTFADLSGRANSIVREYSGGMRKRLDLVMGLVHQPRLLIMDEPTLGLDIQTRRRLWEYVRSLRDDLGITILLTTHYLDEADQLCDRVAIIDQGKIVAIGPPGDLKAELGGDAITISLASSPPLASGGGGVGWAGASTGADNGESSVQAAKAAETLRSLSDVRDAVALGETIRATVIGAERNLPIILAELKAQGIEVAGVSYARPSLDDVFLYHTGHSLRES